MVSLKNVAKIEFFPLDNHLFYNGTKISIVPYNVLAKPTYNWREELKKEKYFARISRWSFGFIDSTYIKYAYLFV